jgi:hypothetical protein
MNRLLIPTLTFAMLLMAGCGEDAGKQPGAPTAPSGESATPAPTAPGPSGEREPGTPPAQPVPPGTEPRQ